MVREAEALTINGSFLHQCMHTPIETIVELCGERFEEAVERDNLPMFSMGSHAIRTPETMATFLDKGIPEDYENIMFNYGKTSTRGNKMNYVDQISDDWKSSSSPNRQTPSSKTKDDIEIQLILVDDTNGGRC
eukprot:829303_1